MTPTVQTQQKSNNAGIFRYSPSEWDTAEKGYKPVSDKDWHKQFDFSRAVYPWEYPPSKLSRLAEAIKTSKYLIDIPDESELNGPKPLDKETWEKGCRFLWRHAEKLLESPKICLETPLLSATPNGGLRFYWNKANYRMLITIHPVKNRVTYYGDNARWGNWEERETTVEELDYKLISWFTLVL